MNTSHASPFENNYTRPMPDPQVVFSQPGYFTPRIRMHGFAVAAVICGAVGLLAFPLLPIALITGPLGMRATKNNMQPGYGAALAGMCLGIVGTIMWLMIFTANLLV